MMADPGAGLASRIRAGEEAALARAISLVENESPGFEALLHDLHADVGGARRMGITGPPGVGKSTMTAALARHLRNEGARVGVIAVDPTSPFTGGALLGDRIRMGDLATEPGVFIRSMASRGSLGGLATAAREAADLMDAAGFDRILIETVGVGQSELEIADSADSTVVVLVPESGDAVQAMKAGLMEVADLFVVNKADRPGADQLVRGIRSALRLRRPGGRAPMRAPRSAAGEQVPVPHGAGAPEDWKPPVLQATATSGEGVPELAGKLDEHFAWLVETGALDERRRAATLEHGRRVLSRAVQRAAMRRWGEWLREGGGGPRSGEPTRGARQGEAATPPTSPYALARRLASDVLRD